MNFFLFNTAPGSVGNINVSFNVGSTFNTATHMYILDITISWEEPINPRGEITSYEVTVAQSDNSSAIIYTSDSLTVTSLTQSVMVLPFTNYTVTVTASTSAGQGDPDSVIILSPKGSKKIMQKCMHNYC